MQDDSLQPEFRVYCVIKVSPSDETLADSPNHAAAPVTLVASPQDLPADLDVVVLQRCRDAVRRYAGFDLSVEVDDPKDTVVRRDYASCTVAEPGVTRV